MSQINTNVQSMLAQRVLGENNKALNTSLERLSTGVKINRGADDPAGLIASENLRSQSAQIKSAIGNAERADQVVNIAEGGLQEVNSLLLEVQGLVGESANEAGLSQEEREANQLQIDSILQTIDRVSESTNFQGSKLLNGSYDYQVESQDAAVADVKVNAAKLENGESREVSVNVTQSAQHAGMMMDMGEDSLSFGSGEDGPMVFEVAGTNGSREFSFASGSTVDEMAETINTYSEITGVSASTGGSGGDTGLVLKSMEMGSDQFVSVSVSEDAGQGGSIVQMSGTDENSFDASASTDFADASNPVRDTGQDIGAIINGVQATADGGSAKISTEFLDVEIDMTEDGAQTLGSVDAFEITGGGAQFNLGPGASLANQVSIGIQSTASRDLGSQGNGFLDELGSGQDSNVVDGDTSQAQKIVDDAIGQVSSMRGRLGAFQKNTVGSTINSLGVQLENTDAAESAIRDTDFAEETAKMTRNQILTSAAQNTLSMANSQPRSALQLLG